MDAVRLLFCSSAWLSKSLGASRHLVELAEALEELGWHCEVVSIPELARSQGRALDPASLSETLRSLLRSVGSSYDIVDYDHRYLPYPRTDFDRSTLMVARSVLLAHHLADITLARPKGLRPLLASLAKFRSRRRDRKQLLVRGQTAVVEADLVSVSNFADRDRLVKAGVPAEKIVVVPLGISEKTRAALEGIPARVPEWPVVGFVGTFDPRKGARDMPAIVGQILEALPEVRLRLLGTSGMHATEAEVLRYFPRRLRSAVEVVPEFAPEELPDLLGACSVGIFPSYLEGFGLGVLEMLAAAIPVVAYDVPGPPMMLTPEYLVRAGDTSAMARKVVDLLSDEARLEKTRTWARERSREFRWAETAEQTAAVYASALQKLRSAQVRGQTVR